MKKITLFITAILLGCASLSAQTMEVIRQGAGGNHSINDSIIVVNGNLPTQIFTIPFSVINKNAISTTLKVKRIDSVMPADWTNYFCWGLCYTAQPAHEWVSPSSQTIPAGDTNTTFTADIDDSGFVGSAIFRYIFYNTGNPNDSTWVIVKFNIGPLGIAQVNENALRISAPYPNPAGNNVSFNYNLNNIEQAKLEVYNTIGQCMQTLPVSASATKLNLNVGGLPSGIYICKFSANGAEPVFQKLIVTH